MKNIEDFIHSFFRKKSFFKNDLNSNKDILKKSIFEKNILVIGGAGTIGSFYLKELINYKPRKIIVVDFNENGLTELTRDLRSSKLLDYGVDFRTYPINLNSHVFDKLFLSESPFNLVSNFAAHKHVRSEKDIFSVEALIRNNVFGAVKLLELLKLNPPNHFFTVSTDKAANPVNIMGASKSLMEKITLSYKDEFKVSTARFANVAFSNGSLLDGFVNRINKNQPLSCPSNVKRFFVSPEESGQICLLASIIGKSGNIFFPKFNFNNDQIYFKDIAMSFLKSLNLKPIIYDSEEKIKNFDIKNSKLNYPIFLYNSDTSGEKLYEEFYNEEEPYDLNLYESLGIIDTKSISLNIDKIINDFEMLFVDKSISKQKIISLLNKYLPDFKHIETGKNLDQKM